MNEKTAWYLGYRSKTAAFKLPNPWRKGVDLDSVADWLRRDWPGFEMLSGGKIVRRGEAPARPQPRITQGTTRKRKPAPAPASNPAQETPEEWLRREWPDYELLPDGSIVPKGQG